LTTTMHTTMVGSFTSGHCTLRGWWCKGNTWRSPMNTFEHPQTTSQTLKQLCKHLNNLNSLGILWQLFRFLKQGSNHLHALHTIFGHTHDSWMIPIGPGVICSLVYWPCRLLPHWDHFTVDSHTLFST
jgi:hypothetical protein